MAGEFANAATLMGDSEFRTWVMVASVFEARNVVTEPDTATDHAVRLKMANAVIAGPQTYLDRIVNVIACDPDVAAAGNTAEAVTQEVLLTKIEQVWTPLAKVLFP